MKKPLTFVLVIDNTNKCDIYIRDYSHTIDDSRLLFSLMSKSFTAKETVKDCSLKSIFKSCTDSTPYKLTSRYYESLPITISPKVFLDSDYSQRIAEIFLCDFGVSKESKPALYKYICIADEALSYASVSSTVAHVKANADCILQIKGLKYYSVADESNTLCPISFGNIENFKKIAEAKAMSLRKTIYVVEHDDAKEDIAYIAKYINSNNVETTSAVDKTYQPYLSDHYVLNVDDKEHLSLTCKKVDCYNYENKTVVKAQFYLTAASSGLFDSSLFFIGTSHIIELTLISSDECNKKTLSSCKLNTTLTCKHLMCDSLNDGPAVIELTFSSKKK
jgi:hypothetical protein